MGYEATMYLLERGVRLTGTDAWSWDAPFVHTAKKYGETQDACADLGRPQGRPRHRLLPPREAAQPGGAAGRRLLHQLLPAQDPRRLGRLDARGRDLRRRADGQRLSMRWSSTHTHDPDARSWLASANAAGCDFPIQNLPFAVFRRAGGGEAFRGGVAIGDQVVDLAALARPVPRRPGAAGRAGLCAPVLNDFFASAARPGARCATHCSRAAQGTAPQRRGRRALPGAASRRRVRAAGAIGDYTDFYTSIDHATEHRPPVPARRSDHAELPVDAHRATTGACRRIGVSGQQFHRPHGPDDGAGRRRARLRPLPAARLRARARHLHRPGQRARASPLRSTRAEEHVFGICLLNDWSARDIQFWEMAPLGPFLAKNFATTRVALDRHDGRAGALPRAWTRPAGDPQPLPYLERAANRAQRRDRYPARSLAADRAHARSRRSAATRCRAPASAPATGPSRRWSRTTRSGGCNLQPATCWAAAHLGPDAVRGRRMIELTQRRQARRHAAATASSAGSSKTATRQSCAAGASAPGARRIGFGESRGDWALPRRMPG